MLPLAELRDLRGKLENQRQYLLSNPGPTSHHHAATDVMDADIRAVLVMIDEELENRHPRPIRLAGREAQAVYHWTAARVATNEEFAAKHGVAYRGDGVTDALNAALARHLSARGLLSA